MVSFELGGFVFGWSGISLDFSLFACYPPPLRSGLVACGLVGENCGILLEEVVYWGGLPVWTVFFLC